MASRPLEQTKGGYGSFGDDEEAQRPSVPSGHHTKGRRIGESLMRALASYRGATSGLFRRGSRCTASVEYLAAIATLEEIDATIDLVNTEVVGGCVIRPVKPQRSWLWRQWRGTVFRYGVGNAFVTMTISVVISLVVPQIGKDNEWHGLVMASLSAFDNLWKYMLTLTIFILTFFLSQAYALWRNVYNLCRSVQGRTNDFGLLCATHAARDKDGQYTPKARKLLMDVAMAVRIFHVFAYATKSRRFRVLHTPRALSRMVERGVMTQAMLDAIQQLDVSTANRPYAMLEWIMIRWTKGLRDGSLEGGPGLEQMLLEKGCLLRSQYGTFGDVLDARIPLAYAHIVQVMVDTLLLCAPFALYSEMEYLCIPAAGVLTIFFTGLLDLSKVMLDPLDNEDFCDEVIEMNVGVFIRESNGGSTRFWKGAERLPKGWIDNETCSG